MSSNKIEVGDIVDITFSHAYAEQRRNCEVLYIPCATGDCWHLRTPRGNIIYVQMFEEIFKKVKESTNGK